MNDVCFMFSANLAGAAQRSSGDGKKAPMRQVVDVIHRIQVSKVGLVFLLLFSFPLCVSFMYLLVMHCLCSCVLMQYVPPGQAHLVHSYSTRRIKVSCVSVKGFPHRAAQRWLAASLARDVFALEL